MWLSEIDKKDRPDKELLFKLRKDKDMYTTFFTRFIQAVVGPELFRQRIQDTQKDNEATLLCTVSDEAFALLLIENNRDRWTDIYDKHKGIPPQRRGDRTKQIDSDIAPKYTHGGIRYSQNTNKKSKGWNHEGIKRYNELFQLVTDDRRKRPKFMARFKAKRQLSYNANEKKQEHEHLKAVHNLWEEETEAPVEHLEEYDSSDDEASSENNDN